jgi:hypothetical protein
MLRLFVISFLFFSFSSAALAQKSKIKLRFIGEKVIQDSLFQSTLLGGFSSLDMATDSTFYILSDSRASMGGARFYTLKLDYDTQKLNNAEFSAVWTIHSDVPPQAAVKLPPPPANGEAIRYDAKSDNFVWASEGELNNERIIQPYIWRMNQKGEFLGKLPMPQKFQYQPDKQKGVRDNKSIESIALSPKNQELWICTEEPLYEDKKGSTSPQDTLKPIRLIKMDMQSGEILAEFAYHLDNYEDNGVVEILVIDKSRLMILERSYSKTKKENFIRLYEVNTKKGFDTRHLPSLQNANYKPIEKKLILDFTDLKKQNIVKRIDNLEGMSWGYPFPNGHRSLIVVSDDNFNRKRGQISQILVFEVEE